MANQHPGERAAGADAQIAVAALSTVEQFVLGVCRCWDAFLDDPDPSLAWCELTPVFAYMNVLGALCAFDRTFAVLHRYRLRSLRFEPVDHAYVGADESRLLCSLACLQRGHAYMSMGVLGATLTQTRVRALLPPLARIAAILDRQGHRLPAWTFKRAPGPLPQDEISWPPLPLAQ